MSSAWYVKRGGRIIGPITWDELQRAARSGKLRPTDPVRPEHDAFWRPAADARDIPVPPPSAFIPQPEWVPEPVAVPPPEPQIDRVALVVDTAPKAAALVPILPGEAKSGGQRNGPGRALLALALAVLGLFGFGLLCGGLAVSIAGSNLRTTRGIGRGFAIAALFLGAAEVAVMLVTVWRTRVGPAIY